MFKKTPGELKIKILKINQSNSEKFQKITRIGWI